MPASTQKRVTVKLKSPNPLFEQWLTLWRDEAVAKESKMQYMYNKALQSLKKYPLPLESGRECKILKGFGDKLCQMLDEKLKQYKTCDGNVCNQQTSSNNNNPKVILKPKPSRPDSSKTIDQQHKQYIPQHGSGGYAILITLYKKSLQSDYVGFLTKNEIIKSGTELVNSSFTKVNPGSRYTAWSSMKTLLSKNLVAKVSHPPKFSLTTEGCILAKKLYEESNDVICDVNMDEGGDEVFVLNSHCKNAKPKIDLQKDKVFQPSMLSNNKEKETLTFKKFPSTSCINSEASTKTKTLKRHASSNSKSSTLPSIAEDFILCSGTFDIILYVDTNETAGSSNSESDEVLVGLKKHNIKHEVKNLKVGDFTWICRDKIDGRELVLPYIIERKRMDDFAHSIRDKRYHEQKFRLKKCGIENLIYLVESYGSNQHLGLPLQSLKQAATNTAIQEGFFVKFTENAKETIEYLANMSKVIVGIFKNKTLISCSKDNLQPADIKNDLVSLMTFKEFNESSMKNKRIKITDLFVTMLIQIKGMSVERALAITKIYPTPLTLKQAYECATDEEKLLATIKYSSSGKSIGAVLSKTVYQTFCKKNY